MEGDIALASIPQADGNFKPRPVLLLRQMPPFGDWLVCGVSSQLHQRVVDFDELIVPGDADFPASGLKAPSVIRLGFIASVPIRRLTGVIGAVSADRHRRLLQKLAAHLRA